MDPQKPVKQITDEAILAEWYARGCETVEEDARGKEFAAEIAFRNIDF